MLAYHYTALTQPSAEFPEPTPIATVNAPSLTIITGFSTETASCASDSRAQSPSLTAPTSSIQASETSQAELVETDGPLVIQNPALSLMEHSTRICAEVMALGDQSLLVYQGMLSKLERLLVGFSRLHGLKPQLIANEQGAPSSSSTEILSVVAVSLTLMFCICICTLADL